MSERYKFYNPEGMPSHLHMIVSRKGPNPLEDIFRDFKKHTNEEQLMRCINEINESRNWILTAFAIAAFPLKRTNQYKVWQDGNHPIELVTNEMMDQRLDYIHNNPVVAGFVELPQYWLYSSAIDYCGRKGILEVELIN